MSIFLGKRRFWLELVVWVLLLGAVYALTQWRGAGTAVPRKMPPLMVQTLAGHRLELPAVPRKILLVNFWAPDCPPCLAETPLLVQLEHWFGGKDFGIVGIAVDGSTAKAVHARMQELGIDYPVYLAAGQGASQAVGGILLTPTSLLINEKGQIVGHFVGAIALPMILWKLFWMWV